MRRAGGPAGAAVRQRGQASRPISTARLCASPRLHLRPIDRMVSPGPSGEPGGSLGRLLSGRASRLDAFSGYPSRTRLPGVCRWRDNRQTGGPSAPVLSY